MAKRAKKPAPDWRKLKDGTTVKKGKKPLSWRARMRSLWVWTRRVFAVAAIAAVCAGGYYVYDNFYIEDIFGGGGQKISKISLKTDGAINGKWLGAFLKISPSTNLDDVNIFAVKKSLEDLEQIKSAQVERVYEDASLRVTITEHMPMMRITVRVNGIPRTYVMSPEGVFFRPVSVDADFVKNLPRIEGARISFDGTRPHNYEHARTVAEFLAYTQKIMPDAVPHWKIIDVSDLGSITLPLIKVITDTDTEIIFAPKDYQKQFDRLDYILRYSAQKPMNKIERIDLSLKDRADVRISENP